MEAASGKTFTSINPATGEVLATVAEGDAEDINRAVSAARKPFEGPWSKFKPYERQQLLLKIVKMSGYGRESGLQHVEEYLNVKAVWIKTA